MSMWSDLMPNTYGFHAAVQIKIHIRTAGNKITGIKHMLMVLGSLINSLVHKW